MRLLLFYENPEMMPRLAAALAQHADVEAVRVVSPDWYLRARRGGAGFGWRDHAAASWQHLAVVPGLRRFAALSAALLGRRYQRAVAASRPDVVLLDSPHLASMLRVVTEPVAYVAVDAYAYYDWDRETTAREEQTLLDRSDVVFAVAHRLADDFRTRGAQNVVHLGTAVPQRFVEACRAPGPAPSDLDAITGPRVGCVGVINDTYDWRLIDTLAGRRPAVSFVFLGPIVEQDREAARRIEAVMARPNVHWLGPRPHAELPRYLAAFDALLNPLRINDHSDRRFPLRLCEYLATDRPVLSTPIHELPWFPPEIVALDSIEDAPACLDTVLASATTVDTAARATWITENTWDARARTVIDTLEAVLNPRETPTA